MSKINALEKDSRDLVATHDYGPAMRALEPMGRSFVEHYMEFGGRPSRAKDAALKAGYSNANENTLQAAASRLINSVKVIRAIREEADLRIRAGAILGASVLIEIAQDSTHKQQLKAAIELLNRADLIVADKVDITIDDKREGKDELIGRVHDLAGRLGIDANLLLNRNKVTPEIIDVTPNKEEEEW